MMIHMINSLISFICGCFSVGVPLTNFCVKSCISIANTSKFFLLGPSSITAITSYWKNALSKIGPPPCFYYYGWLTIMASEALKLLTTMFSNSLKVCYR